MWNYRNIVIINFLNILLFLLLLDKFTKSLLKKFSQWIKYYNMKIWGKKNIGLALGGGGVRGFAHIGVLEVLEENKFEVSSITGTSMGAIIGGRYALLKNTNLLKSEVLILAKRKELKNLETSLGIYHKDKSYFHKPVNFFKSLYFWNSEAFKKSLLEGKSIIELIKELFGEKIFSETQIPFFSVATELNNGDEVIFKKGFLADAIIASCSIPGFFPPVEISDKIFVDGGVTSLVPVSAAKKHGAEQVIAVDVEENLEPKHFKTGIDILTRMDEIRAHILTNSNLSMADIIIHPSIKNVKWYEFSKAEECIAEGRKAAEKNLKSLKRIFERKWWNFSIH